MLPLPTDTPAASRHGHWTVYYQRVQGGKDLANEVVQSAPFSLAVCDAVHYFLI